MDEFENEKNNEAEDLKPKAKATIQSKTGTILIIIGIIVLLTPIVGKIITQNRRDEMLEDFYLSVENNSAAEDSQNIELDEVLEWGVDQSNQDEIIQNSTQAQQQVQDSDSPAIIKKMPKVIGIIKIPSIDVRLPIGEGVDMETLKFTVGHMSNTAPLGAVGNSVLAGHRSYTFGSFFNRLDQVRIGDKITIEKSDGTEIAYTVYKTHLVKPEDTSVLNTTKKDKVLTLITCHPVVNPDSRLIVHAIVK